MRIAIAGFMHESNTFNRLLADRAAFVAQSLTRGADLLDEWREAPHEVGGFTTLEVDTPGLTAVNPQRFDYRNIRRPLYPLN